MGETNDIYAAELVLKKTFPVYTRVRIFPAEDAKRVRSVVRACIANGDAKVVEPWEVVAPALVSGLEGTEWVFLEAGDADVFRVEAVSKKMS